jgi:hypothetical protein
MRNGMGPTPSDRSLTQVPSWALISGSTFVVIQFRISVAVGPVFVPLRTRFSPTGVPVSSTGV